MEKKDSFEITLGNSLHHILESSQYLYTIIITTRKQNETRTNKTSAWRIANILNILTIMIF